MIAKCADAVDDTQDLKERIIFSIHTILEISNIGVDIEYEAVNLIDNALDEALTEMGISVIDVSHQWVDEFPTDKKHNLKSPEPYFSLNLFFQEDECRLKGQIIEAINAMSEENFDELVLNDFANIMPLFYAMGHNLRKCVIDEAFNVCPPHTGFDCSLATITCEYGYVDETCSECKPFSDFCVGDIDMEVICDEIGYWNGTCDCNPPPEEVQCEEEEEVRKKVNVFAAMLGKVGTWASALAIRDLIFEGKFASDRDAARVLTKIPLQIDRPNRQLVREFERLYQGNNGR